MIKREKIEQLKYNKVVKPIECFLLTQNYAYKKSKGIFTRTFGDYEHTIAINVPKDECFNYDSDSEELFMNFNILFSIAIPQFETWLEKKVNRKPNYLQIIETMQGYIKLDIVDDIGNNDFYSIPRNNNIITANNNRENNKEINELESIVKNKLHKAIEFLISNSNISKLFELNKYPMSTNSIGLLIYGGFDEKALSLLDSRYKYELEFMTEKKSKNDNVSYFIKHFIKFIEDATALKNIEYRNPFDSEIVCIQSETLEVKFTNKSIYREILRIPQTETSIQHYIINPKNGDFILFTSDERVLKFNSKGEKLLEFKPEYPKNYTSTWHFSIGIIEGTDCFFINNCIILQNNETIYILKEKWNNKQLISKKITYSTTEKKYFVEAKIIAGRVIPDIIIITLNNDFKTVEIHEKSNNDDYLTKETSKLKNGKLINSPSNNYALWFGNGTKSILFDLKKEEHKTIFGHPTTIKDYIKILYPDCPNNFDITKAIFANDESYLITSALYGKLVAWKLPNFERVELIPNSETIEKLEYGEFFSLGKNSFFKWSNGTFGAYILEIHTLQNSEIFISQTEMITLIWNSKFQNIGYLENLGRIKFHSDKYMTQFIDNELRIYQIEKNK